ncbi:MAG: HDOD domain-containing protein [Fimbriimonadaceae bacterium]|nr:hypothetical protein [Fimbriimonadaceae bacterium]MCC6351303.1 HDOD domain-containing protein [Fimbriimonadaceae bacterium]
MSVKQPTLAEIVESVTELPAMPHVTMAVLREADSEDGSARRLADQLSQDQALAVRVLRLSNSAFYGLPRTVSEIPEAVVVLGTRAIRSLALVASTYPWLSKSLGSYGVAANTLWRHSFGVGICSKLVSQRADVAQPDTAFAGGLLHDIGKVVMGMWLDRHSIDLERIAVSELLTFDQVESKLFGFNHADVGAALAKAWNLPGVLVDAIGHHHPHPDSDSEAVPGTFSDVIRVADAIAYRQGLDMGILGYPRPFDGDSVERLNLTGDQIEDIGSEFASRFEEHQRLFERSTAAA